MGSDQPAEFSAERVRNDGDWQLQHQNFVTYKQLAKHLVNVPENLGKGNSKRIYPQHLNNQRKHVLSLSENLRKENYKKIYL